jgi:glycosyltransferase A (GT-A) superfamily protein (DUF2064 family)
VSLQRFHALFLEMPMSTEQLFHKTLQRFQELGLAVANLPGLGDFDHWQDLLDQIHLLPPGRTRQLLDQWQF